MVTSEQLRCAARNITSDDDDDLSQDNDILIPPIEHSCQIELALSVNFEGDIEKKRLMNKLKNELSASIRAAITIVSRDFSLKAKEVEVRPVKVECAVHDE